MFCFYIFQKLYKQTLVFQISQSSQKLILLAQGQGLEPHLEFSPSVLELGPLLPYAPGDEAEVVVKNPCDFPIEIYSLEFDQQYLIEEKVNRSQNQTPFPAHARPYHVLILLSLHGHLPLLPLKPVLVSLKITL